MKVFIGIDVGLNGGITAVDENGKTISCVVIPTMEIIVNKKKKNQYDIQAIDKIIKGLAKENTCHGILERLRAMPQQSSQSGFSLGYGSAVFETLFTTHGIRYEKVEPAKWQKAMFVGYNYTKEQTKVISVQVAKTIDPGQSFLASERCKKDHDGLTDSFCMAHYLLETYRDK